MDDTDLNPLPQTVNLKNNIPSRAFSLISFQMVIYIEDTKYKMIGVP